MITDPAGRYRPRQTPGARPAAADSALTDEHGLLLRQVAVRSEDLLTVTREDRWPRRELPALLGYVRAEVLRQVVDEERLLFPAGEAPPGFARLSREHLRLRRSAEALADAASGEPGWTPARLAATTRDLLTLLDRHLATEQALLSTAHAPSPVPATADLTGRRHEWYPLTEGTVIELGALAGERMVDAVTERLRRLRTGERVELRCSSDDLRGVWRRMDRLDPGGYGFVYLENGPARWVVRVARRPPRGETR